MKIAIDVDDVLADFISSLVKGHNDEFGTQLKKEDFHTFAFAKV